MRKLYVAALPLVLLFGAFAYELGRHATKPPANLTELVEAAEADGLYWTTGAANYPAPNQNLSVVISEMPITCDDESLMHLSNFRTWKGKAKAYAKPSPWVGIDPPHMDFVGDMVVVGDPEIVARIARLGRPLR
jgi:hypothetical protein